MSSPTQRRASPKLSPPAGSRSPSRGRSSSRKKRTSSRGKASSRSRSTNRKSSTDRKPSTDRKSREAKDGKKQTAPQDKHKKICETCKTEKMEYGGVFGVIFLIFFLPFTVYFINLACGRQRCTLTAMPKIPGFWCFFDRQAALIFFGWLAFQVILFMLPIGHYYCGKPLRSGDRLPYRCNGFHALLISMAAFALAVRFDVPLTIVYDKYYQILTTAFLFSVFLSIVLYIRSRYVDNASLSPAGNTGNVIYDFFVGHELNPRINNFDLKFFFEMRPGLIGWVMINFIFVLKAYQDTGTYPVSLLLVTMFQTIYVADAFFFESSVLTTMDIMCDGFGYMLAFGDLVWVPFLYCLQTRYLLDHPTELTWYTMCGIAALNYIGYYIFRSSNTEKNLFQKNPYDPRLSHYETIPTASGKKLLVSGWWGMVRKPNYLGDLCMALAWSLPCGLNALTYFYPVYFLILLVHRERRDSKESQKKYGSSWDRYCQRVKYRIFPCFY
ncbi:delta(14)-sterol reductase TM7SF2-like [Gigantopelta aegis]|uniref:delta(14)-sterol reductase TM7SF2-like n=1 Tax=Gigantopelta aegis TaxID=1735272 RepID=UPI001B88998A|nr:delta(14)-sterol reductase TM7SF2-like [Gigantopelta aegis]